MIYYNMRYRGPYEYDKFTLNVLNYVNFVTDYVNDMENYKYECPSIDKTEDYITLKEFEDRVNEAFEKTLKQSEQIYKYFIMNKDGE